MEDVPSVTMAEGREALYTEERPTPTKSHGVVVNWKRVVAVKKEPNIVRIEKNFWNRKLNYFLYIILCGNGVEGLPLTFRFAIDLSGGFFVLLLFIFAFILSMPMMYMEIFLGKYTKLTDGQMYRMAPIFFGYSVLVFIINTFNAPRRSADISLYIIGALKIVIDPDYMNACPVNAKECVNRRTEVFTNQTCTYDYMSFECDGSGTKRYVAEYYYWATFRNLEGDYPLWQYVVATIITWICIILLCMLRMKILGIVLRGAFIINLMILSVIFVMAITAKGGIYGLENLVEFKLEQAHMSKIVMVAFFITIKMGVITPSGYMTFSAYTIYKSTMGPGTECLLLSMCNLLLTIYYLVIVHSVAGVLQHNMGIPLDCTFVPFAGLYYAMIPEFLKFRASPNIFIILFHLSNWFLEVVRLALSVHMHVLNLLDFFPKISNYQSYVKLMVGLISVLLSVIASFKIFTIVLLPLYTILETYFIQGFSLFIFSVMVFYCYGVSRLNDDIHFITGRRPIKYWRILWYLYPVLTMIGLLFVAVGTFDHYQTGFDRDIPKHYMMDNMLMPGLLICLLFLCIILFITFFYIVMSIRSSTTIMSLLKPQFHWGPPSKEARIARKSFAPRTSIRSQPSKKKKQRFRPRSIKQMHERDIAEHVQRGRIFLDAMFFTNIGDMGARYTSDFKFPNKAKTSINVTRL